MLNYSNLMYKLYLDNLEVSQLSNEELVDRILYNSLMLHNLYNLNFKYHYQGYKKTKKLLVQEKFWLKQYIKFRDILLIKENNKKWKKGNIKN